MRFPLFYSAIPFVALIASTTSVLHAEEDLARPASLSVRAKELATKKREEHRVRDDAYWYDRTEKRQLLIEAEVTNFGGKAAPGAKVLIYWIAKEGGRLKVVGKDEREIAAKEIRSLYEFESPEIAMRDARYNSYKIKEGDKLSGYVLTLSYQGYDYPVVPSTGASSIRSKQDLDALIKKSEENK